MVLQAREVGFPEPARAKVAVAEFDGEVHVDALDIFGEDSGAWAETDREELCVHE